MIQAHFQNIRSELLKEIAQTEKTLKIAMAWFTNREIFEALLSQCRLNKSVELIIINDAININRFGLDFNSLVQSGCNLYFGNTDNLMHHKFCIIDDKVLINGSYNWTYWAETKNEENITVLKGEEDVVKSFSNEFNRLINSKSPIKNVDFDSYSYATTNDNSFFNFSNIRLNEYINTAIDLSNRGFEEMATDIFEEINHLNPQRASFIFQNGITSNPSLKRIYSALIVKEKPQTPNLTYEGYCARMSGSIRNENYINAINLAKECEQKFSNYFSAHAYCGDAKLKLNDVEGAKSEYLKALNYKHKSGAKLIYYGKIYNYFFLPKADIYLKLGDKEKVIETLEEAKKVYTAVGIPEGINSTEMYLMQLNNHELIARIE